MKILPEGAGGMEKPGRINAVKQRMLNLRASQPREDHMPSDEAVKAAREWMDTTVIGETATELSLADLLDKMMAQARLEIVEYLEQCDCKKCQDRAEMIRNRFKLEHLASPDRQAGRGK